MAVPSPSIGLAVQVYPSNPHLLMYQGRPELLITSAEHYGAVINWDFDYRAYFDALAAYGLNYTRIYPGAYVEVEGMFIENNTLAPRMGRHLLPWARSSQPGAWDGLNRYDLSRWSEAYFTRLRDFLAEAARRGIVVEICFFNCQYPEGWHACPLNAANNIQGVGAVEVNDFQTLKSPALVAAQEAYVRQIIREVNAFDNVVLEICDEPTMKGTPAPLAEAWVRHFVDVIVEVESGLPNRHLLTQQLMVGVDVTADSRVKMVTTQYIHQCSQQVGGPEALDSLYHLDKPIELNETAYYPIWYRGDVVAASRAEAWEFMVGGGAAFNHLNGRFTVADPAGDTSDNHAVLLALKSLKAFLYGFDFAKMRRDATLLRSALPEGVLARAISEPGKQYALYLHHSVMKADGLLYIASPGEYQETLDLSLPPGAYRLWWVNPADGRVLGEEQIKHAGGALRVMTPRHEHDIALGLVAAS